MAETDYEYRGLMAATWDVWRPAAERWSDSALYLGFVRRYGEPVLDVGCGTGRIVLDYAAEGIDVDGVDCSPEMLAVCRDKARESGLAPDLYQGAMEALALPRAYRTVLVPSSTFQLLTTEADARSAMQKLRAHLHPGGVLVMPFGIPWRHGTPLSSGWQLVFEKLRPSDGTTVRRWGLERYDPAEQVWHTQDVYEVLVSGRLVASEYHSRSPAGRWYSQAQAVALYRDAGFDDIVVYAGFTEDPAAATETLFTVSGVGT